MKQGYGAGLIALSLCVAISVVAAEMSAVTPPVGWSRRTTLTPLEIATQEVGGWGLSVEALRRYQTLMSGPRGTQSPGLDPLATLGIEARTDAERRQYAEKWVKAEFIRTEKELRFQREVNAAWRRLYPQMLAVNLSAIGNMTHDTGGRLALFVRAKGCGGCEARLSAVLAWARPVDLYLVDSEGDDDVLRQWAREHRIPAERVRQRMVTLNHGGELWRRVGNGLMPVILQQGSDGWHVVAF